MTLLSLLSLVLAVGTYAQSTPYVDSNTGISFQRYVDTTGFAFGVAAPEDPTGDFIGQIVRTQNAFIF
jgi:cellobiose dehydrogenase (acceptor)